MLNDRSLWLIARNVLRPSNYYALANMRHVYERPLLAAGRYFFGYGEYPCVVQVRTPMGTQSVTLFNSQDAITLHEIFCREDYRCFPTPQVVVDLGSNIGISALYFLTRSASTYCELFEPDPRNVSSLLTNLNGFSNRFTLHEVAVADRQGILPFKREPTGRYGSIDLETQCSPDSSNGTERPEHEHVQQDATRDRIPVRVDHINTILDGVISRHGSIDLLKIDTEGSELATLFAIDHELLSRIRHIVIEWFDSAVTLEGFDASFSCDTIMFSNKVK